MWKNNSVISAKSARDKKKMLYICIKFKNNIMATIKGTYKGNLRNEMTHLQSGNTIITDAPTDNHGKGEAFSPTDLACAALAGCMMTIMGITAQSKGFNIDGTTY